MALQPGVGPVDATTLSDFALQVISLLQNAWRTLSLGEVFLSADDPDLASWGQVLAELEANAVSRVVLDVYRASGPGSGRLLLQETTTWSGRGTLEFSPTVAFDLAAFLVEAERRGIDVLAGMSVLASGATPGDAGHVGHLVDTATFLLSAYPGLRGVNLMDLEAPGQANALTSLVGSLKDAVAASGHKLALLVGSPANDVELLNLSDTKGQDLAVLGTTADLLYLGTVLEDADANGVADHDLAWPGQVVSYLHGLNLSAGLVPLVSTYDLMEPFEDMNGNDIHDADEVFTDVNGDSQWGVGVTTTPDRITATVRGLPGASVCGIAVYSYRDTSAAEWSALLNSHPR